MTQKRMALRWSFVVTWSLGQPMGNIAGASPDSTSDIYVLDSQQSGGGSGRFDRLGTIHTCKPRTGP